MGAAAILLLGLVSCGQHRLIVRTAAPAAAPAATSVAPARSGAATETSAAPTTSSPSPRAGGTPSSGSRARRGATSPVSAPASASASRSRTASATGPLLPTGSCVADSRHGYRPVACSSASAYARVISRRASCPEGTDLRIAIRRGGADAGTACLRKLHGPHPGDPGGGGGTRIRVGDCVYVTPDGIARETACPSWGGTNPHPPQFRVTAVVPVPTACPRGSDGWIVLTAPQTGFACVVRVSTPRSSQDGNSQGRS